MAAGVEEERAHHFLVAGVVAQGEIARHVARPGEGLAVHQLLAGQAPADLHGGEQGRGLRRTDAGTPQGMRRRRQQPAEAAVLKQQVHGELDGGDAHLARAQQHGEQLRVREGSSAMLQQSLPGALARGELANQIIGHVV